MEIQDNSRQRVFSKLQTEAPKVYPRPWEKTPYPRAEDRTCKQGHAIRFFAKTENKARASDRGAENTISLTCAACAKAFLSTAAGFHSCAEPCDFDLCPSCTQCPQGHQTKTQYGIPQKYADKYAYPSVNCDPCGRKLNRWQVKVGFQHCEICDHDKCRVCSRPTWGT